jgi:FAD/FMN-containing dehydrogenase
MESSTKWIAELAGRLGEDQVSSDLPTRIAYRSCHGPESLLHEDQHDFTPAVVVRPQSTEEVVQILKIADAYEVPVVPQGGRSGSFGAEGIRGCIVIDTASMNRIVRIDERNYRITAEAGVRVVDYNNYLEERGFMSLEHPTMVFTSTMGSRGSLGGYNKFENTWGGSAVNTKALEVVLANGKVVEVGRGSRVPTKNVTGFDLMSLFLGSRGSFGVVTKTTEQFIDMPERQLYGVAAFERAEDAMEAYIELLSSKYTGLMWRAKTYHKMRVGTVLNVMLDKVWPDDIMMVTDYNIFGPAGAAEDMDGIAKSIMKKHNGFWRDDIPSIADIAQRHHEAMGKYVGMGSLHSSRIKDGSMGYRLVPLDPIIPHSRLIEFSNTIIKHLMKIEDKKSYPPLADKLYVFDPGAAVPGEMGFSKLWMSLNANWKLWDNETRQAFKDWFRDYAELVWSHGGALTGTHGFIPADMQTEVMKKEIGENEYELMKTIKNALDPKNIMNPKVRF